MESGLITTHESQILKEVRSFPRVPTSKERGNRRPTLTSAEGNLRTVLLNITTRSKRWCKIVGAPALFQLISVALLARIGNPPACQKGEERRSTKKVTSESTVFTHTPPAHAGQTQFHFQTQVNGVRQNQQKVWRSLWLG